MKVVILCGGKGIRAFPFTEYLPKPMMPVGGRPILVHIIQSYLAQGFSEFVLAAGHRKAVLDDYFENKHLGARIQVVDTGDESDTAERIWACRSLLGERFMATYGDGLSDLPLRRLLSYHEGHGRVATMGIAPLVSQYGVVDVAADGQVLSMREKPVMRQHWINIGFFVFEARVFDTWQGSNLERDILPALVARGELAGFRHDGFFKSMDSFKDNQEFEELHGRAGRKPWDVAAS